MANTPVTRATAALAELYRRKSKLDINHKVVVAPIEAQIAMLEEKLIVWFDKQGAEKSVLSGVEYTKKPRQAFSCSDRIAFWEWVTQSPTGFTFFKDSVIQKEVEAYAAKHAVLPPGIKKATWTDSKLKLKK